MSFSLKRRNTLENFPFPDDGAKEYSVTVNNGAGEYVWYSRLKKEN